MCSSIGCFVFFFKQKTAYEMRISDWSSDVCSSDLMATPSDRRFIYGSQSTPLAIVHDFVRECDRAIARSEKDQALFYWYPDKDDIDNSSTTGWHLGSEGITFFDVDSIEDYFYGDNLSHGLWINDRKSVV